MNWLQYLVEANIYLGVFYLCYCLFLTNETHYNLSRVYLLFTCVISYILPVTQLSVLKPVEQLDFVQPMAYVNTTAMMKLPPPPPPQAPPFFTWQDGLFYVYIIGAIIALGVFGFRLFQLYKLSRRNKQMFADSYQLIHLPDDNTAFSFFNYLFIGSNISLSDTIIAHELVHIRQKHSWDIMLLEVLKVVSWFNPFVYLTQRSLKTVHEYIADEQTAAHERDALTYSSFLLNNAYGIQGSTIAHSFFNYNLLKKRIIMLNKNRSGKLARLKYLAVLPLCGGMLCASTLAFAKDYGWVDLTPKKAIAEKPKVKRLKIIDGETTLYSDNISVKEKDGSRKKYLVSTITANDISYLLKEHKLTVTIIEVDSASNKANPTVMFPDKTDTTKRRLPPPPPAPPKAAKDIPLLPPPPIAPDNLDLITYMLKHVRYPAVARNKQVTGNILLSFRLDKTHKISDVKIEKGIGNGCDEEAIRALKSYSDALPKPAGAYKIMVTYALISANNKPVNPPKQIDYKIASRHDFVGQVRVTGYVADQIKLPPSPPAPPKPVKIAALSDDQKSALAFNTAIAQTIRYPKASRENDVAGRVIATFKVEDGKISNVKIVRGIDNNADAEIKRVLEGYNGSTKLATASYALPVLFALVNENGEVVKKALSPNQIQQLPPPPPPAPPTNNPIKYFTLNEIVVTGYANGVKASAVSPTTSGKITNPQGRQSFIIPPAPAGTDKNAKIQKPPAAYDRAYVNLYNHMTQAILYPDAAIKSKTTGNVILSYRVDANHKITDIKVMNSVGGGCDESAIAALKSYRGNIDKASGNYVIAAAFVLKGFTKKFEPIGDVRFKPNFAGVVVVGANAI